MSRPAQPQLNSAISRSRSDVLVGHTALPVRDRGYGTLGMTGRIWRTESSESSASNTSNGASNSGADIRTPFRRPLEQHTPASRVGVLSGQRTPANPDPMITPRATTAQRTAAASGLSASSASENERTVPPRRAPAAGSPFALPQGPSQRLNHQDFSAHQNALQELQNVIKVLTATVTTITEDQTKDRARMEQQDKKINELETQVNNLRVLAEEGNIAIHSDEDDVETTGIGRLVRGAARLVYGCKLPQPYPSGPAEAWPRHKLADGTAGGKVMRWDFTKAYSHEVNVYQTELLVNAIKNNRSSIELKKDIPITSIPLYETHKDVYQKSIARYFRQEAETYRRSVARDWHRTGRVALLSEISSMKAGGSQPAEIASKEAYVRTMDQQSGTESKDPGTKGVLRPRLQTMANYMAKRRPHTRFRGEEWECLDSVYCQMALTTEKFDGAVKFYWPDKEAAYSQRFIRAYEEVYSFTSAAISKGGGTTISDPYAGMIPQAPVPYWPSRSSDIHAGPQRWMFTEEWVDSPDNADVVAAWLIPTDDPTSFTDIKASDWYKNRFDQLGGGGRKAKARRGASQLSESSGGASRSNKPVPKKRRGTTVIDEDEEERRLDIELASGRGMDGQFIAHGYGETPGRAGPSRATYAGVENRIRQQEKQTYAGDMLNNVETLFTYSQAPYENDHATQFSRTPMASRAPMTTTTNIQRTPYAAAGTVARQLTYIDDDLTQEETQTLPLPPDHLDMPVAASQSRSQAMLHGYRQFGFRDEDADATLGETFAWDNGSMHLGLNS